MTKKKIVVYVLIAGAIEFILILGIYGCVQNQTQVIKEESIPNYSLNESKSVPVGAVMISKDSHKVVKTETWAGTGIYAQPAYDTDHFRQELIYSGIANGVVRVSYREFMGRNNMARPSFFQELSYDLKTSPIIVFRNLRIEVREADNEKITFVVLKDQ